MRAIVTIGTFIVLANCSISNAQSVEKLNPNNLKILALETGYPGANSLVIMNGPEPIVVVGNTKLAIAGQTKVAATSALSGPYMFRNIIKLANHYTAVINEAILRKRELVVDYNAVEPSAVLLMNEQ